MIIIELYTVRVGNVLKSTSYYVDYKTDFWKRNRFLFYCFWNIFQICQYNETTLSNCSSRYITYALRPIAGRSLILFVRLSLYQTLNGIPYAHTHNTRTYDGSSVLLIV